MYPKVEFLQGDALTVLRTLPGESVHCCATSPPYWGLRDYGVSGQLGLEKTPEEYVAKMVEVFREVRRVLRGDGTCWINLGDSYWGGKGQSNYAFQERRTSKSINGDEHNISGMGETRPQDGKHQTLKPKDLCGIPWRVAFALQSDGWWLRQDIIWNKRNPMPESVTDRCTKAHEYIFLMAKSERYYYDADSISQPAAQSSIDRLSQPTIEQQVGSTRVPGKTNGNMKAVFGGRLKHSGYGTRIHSGNEDQGNYIENGVNKRSVWTVATQPFKEAHFATFPPDLIKPCILAGCPIGGTVLDPFGGSGTTGMVALELGRSSILIELNPKYIELARKRCEVTPALALA